MRVTNDKLPMGKRRTFYPANSFEGLAGKDNLEKAWCDAIVGVLKDVRKECQPFTPYYRKEADDAKFVSFDKLFENF